MATLSRELAFPLQIDASGGLAFFTKPEDKASAHVRMVLGTEIGERVMSATYGTRTLEHLFDAINDETIADLERDVADSLAQWADEITVRSIDTQTDESEVVVTVIYSLNQAPDSNESVSVSLPVQG